MKAIIAILVLATNFCLLAEPYCWTGGAGPKQDGTYSWNDAANWAGEATPQSGADVVLGQMQGNPMSVTLDLTDMQPVGSVRIKDGSAPAYLFGTTSGTSQTSDDGQSFWIAANGQMVIDADVVNDQTFRRLAYHPTEKSTVTLSNASEQASFVVDTLNHPSEEKQQYTFAHFGIGRFVWCSKVFFTSAAPDYTFNGSNPVVWRQDMGSQGKNVIRPFSVKDTCGSFDIEVEQGGKLYGSNGSSPFTGNLNFSVNARIHGAGVLAAFTHANSATGAGNESIRGMGLYLSKGKTTVDVDVPMMPWNYDFAEAAQWWDGYVPLIGYANSVINLNSTNGCSRACRIYGRPRVNVRKLGNMSCSADETSIGPGEIVFSPYFDSNNSKLRMTIHCDVTLGYSGEGAAETDRNFFLTNAYYEVGASAETGYYNTGIATGCVANAGSGLLKLTGEVRALNPNAAFVLQPETAPIEFAGSFASSPAVAFAVRGEEEVRMAAIPENVASFSMLGARLRLTETGEFNGPIAILGENNSIAVADGKTLTLTWSDAICAHGALDVSLGAASKVLFAGATSATSVPPALTVNGGRAAFTDDGELIPYASYWGVARSGRWGVAENWNPSVVPTGDRVARIEVGGADYTVVVDQTPEDVDHVIVGQGDTGYTSTLSISAQMESVTRYDVRNGGLLCVTNGGALEVSAEKSSVNLSPAGELLVVEQGEVMFSDAFVDIVSGTMTFAGSGRLVADKKVTFCVNPNQVGGTATLVFDNRGSSEDGCSNYFARGGVRLGDSAGGTATLVVHGKDSSDAAYNCISSDGGQPWQFDIGYNNGLGVFNIDGGYVDVQNNGFYVPGWDISAKSEMHATGVVNQTAGFVKVRAYGDASSRRMLGLSVGCCDYSLADSDKVDMCGRYNLSGGTLRVDVGYAIIGSGNASGVIRQTGGTFYHSSVCTSTYTNHLNRFAADSKDAGDFRYPVIIGLAGGKGLYEISGGTATIKERALYLGTGYTDEFPWAIDKDGVTELKPDAQYFDYSRSDAEGVLRVSGGAFSCSTNVYIGSDKGTGTIEMVGNSGELTVGRLIATNGIRSVFKFVCDKVNPKNGVSPIAVSGDALVDGATLDVDLGDEYCGRSKIRLINAPDVEGEFSRVSVVGNGADGAVVKKDASGLYLHLPKGLVLIVR